MRVRLVWWWSWWSGAAIACGSGAPSSPNPEDEGSASSEDADASTSSSTSGLDADGSTSTSEGSTAADESSSESSPGEPEDPPAIGLVQYDADAHFGDAAFNRASLTMWADVAVERGAKIVVFPEGSTYGYASADETWCRPGLEAWGDRSCRDVTTIAEPLPGGPTSDHWQAYAEDNDVFVVYHVPERDGAALYNAVGIAGPDGFVGRYRKRLLYQVDEAYADEGDASFVLETPWGRFGLLICLDATYDGPFYDEYVAAGVDGVVVVMDWDDDPNGGAAARTWFAERAEVNEVAIYGADVSTWDGTGLYLPGMARQRDGLPPVAIGVDGVSIHPLAR